MQSYTKMNPAELINWGELSRLIVGERTAIRKNRIPVKHEKSVQKLLDAIQKWDEERKNE
jgi:hypothetical protein